MFRKKSRAFLADLTATKPRQVTWETRTSLEHLIDPLTRVIESDDLLPIALFNAEYSIRPQELSIGCLFEPLPGINISPLVRLTKKEKSPFFCARISLSGMGYAYLIPVSEDPFKCVLVIRPLRKYRLPFHIKSKEIPPCGFTLLYPPFTDLENALQLLSLQHEARIW